MKKNILVIDDIPETREFIKFILEDAGYKVSEAEDGTEGLKKAQREPFDLIITDLAMPGMDGYSLVEKLRSSRPVGETSIVVSSAHGKLKDMFEADDKLGIQGFLEKPFMAEELTALVGKLLK
jgi:two-component system, chemotaxis family, chemotaxis protein CheY